MRKGRFITEILESINRSASTSRVCHGCSNWQWRYWWLSKGRWSHLGLAKKKAHLLSKVRFMRCYLSADNTVVCRSSRTAPGAEIHHEPSNKINRPRFINGQCLVFLVGTFFVSGLGTILIRLLSRLTPTVGNTGKLKAVEVLWRVLKSQLKLVSTYVLMDSWFMRRSLIESLTADDGAYHLKSAD